MGNENTERFNDKNNASYKRWRMVHLISSALLGLISLLHSILTFFIYTTWSSDAVWFLGTGIGMLMLAVFNLSHIGYKPCRDYSAPFVRLANWFYLLFGISAIIVIPEPQALAIVICLAGQAIAGNKTIPGPEKISN